MMEQWKYTRVVLHSIEHCDSGGCNSLAISGGMMKHKDERRVAVRKGTFAINRLRSVVCDIARKVHENPHKIS